MFLLGHSMGSLMARIYASRYGDAIDGLVLTGTGHVNPVLIGIVRGLAKLMMLTLGRRHRSPLLQTLVFGTLNRPFGGETGSEFICSDPEVVKAYAARRILRQCGSAPSLWISCCGAQGRLQGKDVYRVPQSAAALRGVPVSMTRWVAKTCLLLKRTCRISRKRAQRM